MPSERPRPEDHLPLGTQTYHVLLALGDQVLHGYGIIGSFEAMTAGRETLLPGSLYATLARMVEAGLLEEVPPPDGESSGGPSRRYYRVTPYGRMVAQAETERMERLVAVARRGSYAAEPGR